ncbi:MAG: AAA family ATPase [Firmicutes bacterium]|nr:AAA family ATPase [Bacillota bacterium]
MAISNFEKNFSNLVNAGFPYLYIQSYEEERVINSVLRTLANRELVRSPRELYIWSETEGFVCDGKRARETRDPLEAIEFAANMEQSCVCIFKDFHIYFGADRGTHPDHVIIRRLRDALPVLKATRKTIVFLSPRMMIPADMEKEISVIDFPLPNEAELGSLLDDLIRGLSPGAVRVTAEEKKELTRSALGLTMQEAENAFSRAIVDQKGLTRGAISIIHDEKNQVVKKTGVLEFVHSDLGIRDIGGLENLKNWLLKRNHSWDERAKAYGLPAPKGVLITGVPGCGKSMTAKAMSAIWNLPLLKLDMGKIFGGIVGSSEENIRKAIQTAEAIAPSILWVDEIEKGFAGTHSDGDSGTAARVFGTFLTWMQDKTAPVFVIATSNDISSLPPELLRKGRFDEIFFVDLPTLKEREKIFQLHLSKRIRQSDIPHEISLDEATLHELAALSEGFSGAEIEQAVVCALYEAFFDQRGLRKGDVEKSIRESVALSVTQREQILALREWAKTRAVLATARSDREETAGSHSRPIQGGRIIDYEL